MQSRLTKSDHIYLSLKEKIIAYEFSQGKRIYIGPLAEQFGVSTTPVRESLHRLAAEGLVIRAQQKGFFAMTLCEKNVREQYEVTRQILCDSLDRLSPAEQDRMHDFEPLAAVSTRIGRHGGRSDAGTLAALTGNLFASIANFTNKSYVELSIDRANDHLYYVRTLECRQLEHVPSELSCLCELFQKAEIGELVAAIGDYHDRRLKLLPSLLTDRS